MERRDSLRPLVAQLELEDCLNIDLLSQALIHPSYAMEHHGRDNQRLEFLGDAVVDLVIGEYLYQNYPTDDEGQLTKMRATLVCEASLAAASRRLGLGQYLLLGRGEETCGGASRPSNLADAFEAVCGAVYLSCGIKPLMRILAVYLGPEMRLVSDGYYGDYKTRLQEYVQQEKMAEIVYELKEETGPGHNKRFRTEVVVGGEVYGSGWGRTKKASERAAALEALVAFGQARPIDCD